MYTLGSLVMSRTGEHIYGIDKDVWEAGGDPRALVEVMSDQGVLFVSYSIHLY